MMKFSRNHKKKRILHLNYLFDIKERIRLEKELFLNQIIFPLNFELGKISIIYFIKNIGFNAKIYL